MISFVSTQDSGKNRALYKRMLLLLSLSLFFLISLYVFLIAPFFVKTANHVLYMGTWIPEILSTLLSTVDILVFGIFYGVLLYALYRFKTKTAFAFLLVHIGAILYKYVGNLLMTYATDGVPISGISFDVISISFYIVLEIAQTSIVFWIASAIVQKAREREQIRFVAAKKAGKDYVPSCECLPFTRLLNFGNPLQRAAIGMAFVPMTVHVLQRLLSDVFQTIVEGFYRNPLVDILWMIVYYALDIIAYGVIVYFIEILLVSKLDAVSKSIDRG